MRKHTFYIVDVFAETKYAGNPLAVVKDAKALSTHRMQQIAKEMNYSETAFILSKTKQNGGYNVRIFTPEREIPFGGHPTLGTAYVIQQKILRAPVHDIILNLQIGQIHVSLNYREDFLETLWMRQKPPVFGQKFDPETVARGLSLDKADIDERFPIQEMSTGLPFIMVPLKNLDALRRATVVREKYLALVEHAKAKATLMFCPETYREENDLNVRVFADCYGVPEDPATGSANGCLAGYLVKTQYFGKKQIDIQVEQGYEIDRPSLLYLRATNAKGKIAINVGGKVKMTAKGKLI